MELAFKLTKLSSRASWIKSSAFGFLRAVERLFWHERCSHSFAFELAKSDLDNGQLLAKDGSCATCDSKVKTRTVNELKMRSQTGKVASVGF